MKKSIVQLASVYLVGSIFGRGVFYGTNVLLSRGLGPDALGVFAFGLTVIKIGSLLGNIGLDETVQRFVPKYVTSDDDAKLQGLLRLAIILPFAFGGMVSVILYSLRGYAAPYTDPWLLSQVTPLLIAIPFYGATSVLTDATRAFKETKYVVYVKSIALPSITLVGAIIAVYVFRRVDVFVYGYVVAVVVAFALSVLSLVRGVGVDITGCVRYPLGTVREYAIPMMAITAVTMVFSNVDILMLSGLVSATEVGWYQAAFTTSMIVTMISAAGTSILPSLASELHVSEDYDRLEQIYQGITKWITSLTLAGVLGMILFAEDVMLVFGIEQPAAELTLIILALTQLFAVSTGPAAQVLKMTGWERLIMYNTGVLLLVNILLNYYLIPQYAVVGAAIATGISLASVNLIQAVELWYLMDIEPHALSHWRGGILAIVTVPAMLFFNILWTPSIVRVGVAAVVSIGFFSVAAYAMGLDSTDKILFKNLN
ncbi:flippase [Haloarcula sp. AONF1]